MYTPVVSRPSDPARLQGIEEMIQDYVPDSLQQYIPTNPATLFVYGAIGLIGISILFSGGVGGGTYRGRR